MGIQIVGEPEALKSIGLETDSFGDRLEQNLSQLTKATELSSSLKTVSIPDLRNTTENLPTAKFEPESRSSTGKSSSAISNLEQIRKSIESSFDFNGNTISPERQIEQLRKAIDGPRTPASETNEEKLPESEIQDAETESRHSLRPGKTENDNKNLLPTESCYLAQLNVRDKQIQPIIEAIDKQFPDQGLTILSFTGSEYNTQLGDVVARSAVALHQKTKARILIVDCDVEQTGLSNKLQADRSRGLVSLNNSSVAWDNIVVPTSFAQIDAVTIGPNHSISEPKISQLIKAAVGAMQQKYDFVLVNAGDAHHPMARVWSNHVNGTFLLVSLEKSNQEIAKSAVTQLNHYGARLIGCVVSGSD